MTTAAPQRKHRAQFFAPALVAPATALTIAGLLLLAQPGSIVTAAAQTADAPQSIRVGVVTAAEKPINPAKEFVGRVSATERVEVRARVTGYLEAVLFKEGQSVKEGDVLYRIERAPFEAAVAQAEGALDKARGQVAFTQQQLARAEQLLSTQTGTQATRDQRLAEKLTAEGDQKIAESNLQTAQINLGYTEIKSPITGLIGRTSVTKGNVVGPNSGVLTTIVSQDPMYVTIPVSQREFLSLRSDERNRDARGLLSAIIRFSDGSQYDETGKIDFVDVTVDRATDSVTVRAVVPNPKGQLIDGQLVKVALQLEAPVQKILIPQSALIADQKGVYVFVVADGKAEQRRLTLGGEIGTNVSVDDGLKVGDQVIVEGMEALRPGTPVTPYPVAALPNAG